MYTTPSVRPLVEVSLDSWRHGSPQERADVALQIDAAGRDPGVFMLRPLPAMAAAIADSVAATKAFFALPVERKRACEDPEDQFVGYRGLGANRNTYGGADVKEMFHIGPRHATTLAEPCGADDAVDVLAAEQASRLWPSDLPAFVVAWHRYYGLMQEVAGDLRNMYAAALGGGTEVVAQLADLWARNSADLAANSYPVGDPDHAGQVRNAAHADMTLFTVLHQDGRAGGLSLEWADGTWDPVDMDGAAFLVNIGLLFELITCGHWRAVPHRVEPAPAAAAPASPRLTIPFFFRPRPDAVLQPLSGFERPDAPAPQTMAEWLAARRRAVAAPIRPA
jgi:isopenicillin N synthase-like dioxygenase